MFYQLLFTQNVQISIVFLSVKLIIMKIKEWDHISLTSNISAKTWSNCTCRGCFEIIRTSRFHNWTWFWKLSKICGSNWAKQNITNLFPPLYNVMPGIRAKMHQIIFDVESHIYTITQPVLHLIFCSRTKVRKYYIVGLMEKKDWLESWKT